MRGTAPNIAFSLMGLATIAMGVYACWESWCAFASQRWPATKGRLLSGGIYRGGKRSYRVRVLYEYTVDGVRFESDRIRFGRLMTSSYQSAAYEMAKLMPVGGLIVYYDSAHPHRSCLIPGLNELNLSYPIIVLPTGCFMLYAGLFLDP